MVVAVIWVVDVRVDAALEDCLVVEWFDGGFVCCAGEVDVLAVFCYSGLLFIHFPRNQRMYGVGPTT